MINRSHSFRHVLISLVICLMITAMSPVCTLNAAAGDPPEGYTYEVLEDDTCRIISYFTFNDYPAFSCPRSLDGHIVTEIGDHAFTHCGYEEARGSLPDTIRYIGDYALAFSVDDGTYMTFPNSVQHIGKYAFKSNTLHSKSITELKKTTYDDYAFAGAIICAFGKGDIIIPDYVTDLGIGTFSETKNDEFEYILDPFSVIIPSSITILRENLFKDSSGLGKITIPKSVKKIETDAFYNCTNLSQVIYEGTEEEWKQIEIQPGNEILQSLVEYDGEPKDVELSFIASSNTTYTGYHAYIGQPVGDYVDLPLPSKKAYTFLGWFTEKTGGEEITPSTILTRDMGNVFYAHWKRTPPALKKIENTASGIKITWSKTGASKYYIYRKTSTTSWKKIAATSAISYVDTAVAAGKNYTYTVRAYVNSKLSGYDKTGLTMKRLTVPKLKSLKKVSSGVKLTWGAVTGAVKYRVYRKEPGGTYQKLKDSTNLYLTDKSVKRGKTYIYTVKAYAITYSGTYASTVKRAGLKINYK